MSKLHACSYYSFIQPNTKYYLPCVFQAIRTQVQCIKEQLRHSWLTCWSAIKIVGLKTHNIVSVIGWRQVFDSNIVTKISQEAPIIYTRRIAEANF